MGKSTFVDYAFVIQPFLYAVQNNIPVEWIYFSFELDRISKEFDFAAYFLFHDFGMEKIQLDEGITYTSGGITNNIIDLSPDYLRGRLQDDNGNIIRVKESVQEALKVVYENRIIPLFGEYAQNGELLKKGLIKFIEQKDNPTGIYKFLKEHAKKSGRFVSYQSGVVSRIGGYVSDHPEKYTIIIMDHLRKLINERGWQMKQTVDKMVEYMVELRNWCGYTFVPIIHTNRGMTDVDRIRHAKDELYPTSDDIKDTGLENRNFLLIFVVI